MLHYLIIALVVLFCAYEFLPKKVLDLGSSFALKLAKIYESIDSKIQLENIDYNKEQKTKRVKIKKITNFFFRSIFLALAFIVIVFWDIFWHLLLKRFFDFLNSLKLYEKFKNYIRNEANKYFVLFIFISLFIILEYFGIYSGVLAVQGQITLAVLFYIAKFLMVFPVKILYKEGHDKLVEIPWFNRRKNLLVSLLLWFEGTSSFKKAKELIFKIKDFFRKIKNRFRKNKQYKFIFQFKAYKRLLRMKKARA